MGEGGIVEHEDKWIGVGVVSRLLYYLDKALLLR